MHQEISVVSIEHLEKGRERIELDNDCTFLLYRGEVHRLQLKEGEVLSPEIYEKILTEILGVRAKRRAMHLLERMDRTEKQLRDKLLANGYPQECIDQAVDYVKSYHYIDDMRYAQSYIRIYQEKRSRQRLKTDLCRKGIDRETVGRALDEAYCSDERIKILELLQKRHYDFTDADASTMRKNYQFLLRRGFVSHDILSVMKEQKQCAN